MSIINDALKKIQQYRSDNTPAPTDEAKSNAPSSEYIYANPEKSAIRPEEPSRTGPASPLISQVKSILALLCAVVITLTTFWFLFKQVNIYFPQLKNQTKTSFYKLIHRQQVPDFKTKNPKDLVPLAKIAVIPPSRVVSPSTSNAAPVSTPQMLNIHGVMSNGSSNLVLIDNNVYQEGDEVDGIKIVRISLNSLTIIKDGKEETIPVKN